MDKDIYAKQLAIFEEHMDRQQRFYDAIWHHVDNYGKESLPREYTKAWICAQVQGRKQWRDCPRIVRRIKAAARKATKNIEKRNRSKR